MVGCVRRSVGRKDGVVQAMATCVSNRQSLRRPTPLESTVLDNSNWPIPVAGRWCLAYRCFLNGSYLRRLTVILIGRKRRRSASAPGMLRPHLQYADSCGRHHDTCRYLHCELHRLPPKIAAPMVTSANRIRGYVLPGLSSSAIGAVGLLRGAGRAGMPVASTAQVPMRFARGIGGGMRDR